MGGDPAVGHGTRMTRGRQALIGVVLVALVVGGVVWATGGSKHTVLPAAVPANPKPAAGGSTQCAPVTGRRWVYPADIAISGTKYEAFTVGFRCARTP